MKITLILFFLFMSSAFSQNFGYNIALIGQFPQGEFKDEGVGTGLGLDFNIAWYPLDKIFWGLNFGGSEYGSSKRKIPFNFFSDLIFDEIIVDKIIKKKDIIMLVHAGHGFKVLKDVEMIEIKQGPYSLIKDKIKFENINDNKIRIRK